MISYFNVDKLDAFLQSLYTAVGIRFSVFDDEFNLVTEYPKNLPEYCSLIRTAKEGAKACRNCDVSAFEETKRRCAPYVYVCHAGLVEAVAPIKLDGAILGYVILAHMLPKENYDGAIKNAVEKATSYGLKEEDVTPMLQKIEPLSRDKIDACVGLLNAVVAYLQSTDLVKWKAQHVAYQITEFIENNLSNQLSSNDICKKFLISRTKLHQIAVKNYGTSISKYVLNKKIELAKNLLGQGLSVSKVAEKTGFDDFNYFGKVFKKQVGLSPARYKKSLL